MCGFLPELPPTDSKGVSTTKILGIFGSNDEVVPSFLAEYALEEMKKKGLIEGEHYKLRTPNSYFVRTKSGKWGMIAYANEIHSVMIGYKRGRFTGGIDASGWTKDHPKEFETLKNISKYNERSFAAANASVYQKQKTFAETSIKPEHRIGIFTTLSANRYHSGQSTKMAAHVDSGDTEFGMTTMCVFRQGDFSGAYLTFPRYGIAIDAPDNSVVIADSREIHGVCLLYTSPSPRD